MQLLVVTFSRPAVKCGSADVDTCKMRINYADFSLRIHGYNADAFADFLRAVFSAEAGLLLTTKDCTPTLGHTNYTQMLGERFLTCKLYNLFNEVLK